MGQYVVEPIASDPDEWTPGLGLSLVLAGRPLSA